MDPVSHVLTGVPVVYHRVFDYLSLMDLYRVKTVCKVWKKCAEYKIAVNEQCYKAQVLTFAKKTRKEAFVSFNRAGGISSWKKDSENFCKIQEWRNGWTSVPHSGICMSFWKNSSRNSFADTENMIRYWLPTNSRLLVLPCLEYTISVDNDATSYENVDDVDFVQNFISFPTKTDRHSVEFFHLGKSDAAEGLQQFKDDIIREANDPSTKFLFVCADFDMSEAMVHGLVDDVLPVAIEKGVVVLGCLFDKPVIYNPHQSNAKRGKRYKSESVVLSFKGEGVRAASLLINFFVHTTVACKQRLEKLKNTVINFCKDCPNKCANRNIHGYCDSCSSQTIAFMVACVARCRCNVCYYDEENGDEIVRDFETRMFRSMIPNVPIIGTYGMGEIGYSMNLFGGGPVDDDDDGDENGYVIRSECTVFAVLRFQ